MLTKYWRWIAALGAIVMVSLITLRLSFGDSLMYFYTPDEVIAKREMLHDKHIRVGGLVMPGSVVWHAETRELLFTVSDGRGAQLAVHYTGQKPDLFRENQGVVVDGTLALGSDTFLADRLLIKHSEKYSGKKHDGSAGDKRMLQESLIEQ